MTGRITLKLVDSFSKIEKDINAAIAVEMNLRVKKNLSRFTASLRSSIRSWVISQPEILSLSADGVAGTLNAQFGLYPGTGALVGDVVADAVSNSIEIKIKEFNKNLKGYVTINVQPKTFRDILSIPYGTVITSKGVPLHWLNWLLTKGDSIIIVGYEYRPGTDGRSGGGIMEGGVGFRVDPSWSGTTDNNFITRALVHREKELDTLIQHLIS